MSPLVSTPVVAERLSAFLDRLSALGPQAWLAIGRAAEVDHCRAARSAVRPLVDAIIADQRLALAAWQVGDAIDALGFRIGRLLTQPRALNRRLLAAARQAALDSALALLVQEHLPASDITAMCSPLASCIPAAAFLPNA